IVGALIAAQSLCCNNDTGASVASDLKVATKWLLTGNLILCARIVARYYYHATHSVNFTSQRSCEQAETTKAKQDSKAQRHFALNEHLCSAVFQFRRDTHSPEGK